MGEIEKATADNFAGAAGQRTALTVIERVVRTTSSLTAPQAALAGTTVVGCVVALVWGMKLVSDLARDGCRVELGGGRLTIGRESAR